MADHFNTILPSGVNIASMEFTSNQPTVRTQSLSGRTQVRSFGGQFWTARITMQTMTRSELRKVYGFLVKQKGGFTAFTISPTPLTETTVSGVTTVGIKSTSTTAQKALGSTSIEVDDVNKFTAGDMINFNNTGHTKAYMVTTTLTSDHTIDFEPGLVQAVADTDSVLAGSNFKLTCRLAGDEIRQRTDSTGYGTLEFDVVEAV